MKITIIVSLYNSDNFIYYLIETLRKLQNNNNLYIQIYNFINSHKNPNYINSELQKLKKPNNITIYTINENMDLYELWTYAIKNNVNTTYISNLNVDDRPDPLFYNECLKYLNNDPSIDLISSNIIYINDIKGTNTKSHTFINNKNNINYYDINEMIKYDNNNYIFIKNNIPHCCPIWKKELHDKYGYFDGFNYDFAGDYEFWCRCICDNRKFAILNYHLVKNYQNCSTASNKIWYTHNEDYINSTKFYPNCEKIKTEFGEYHDKIHYILNDKVIQKYIKFTKEFEKKITVLIGCYNKEKYIKNTIESVLNQEHRNFEIILIDDCSTDKSYEIIEKYKYYPNIRIIRLDENIGRSNIRNKLMNLTETKYFMFLDGDDIMPQSTLKNFYKKIDLNINNYLLFGNFRVNYDYEKEISDILFKDIIKFEDFNLGWPHFSSVLYDKTLITEKFVEEKNSLGYFKMGEDWSWLYENLKNNNLYLKNIGENVFQYNINESSSSFKNRDIALIDTLDRLYKMEIPISFNKLSELIIICILNKIKLEELLIKYNYLLYEHLKSICLIVDPDILTNCVKIYFKLDIIDYFFAKNYLLTEISRMRYIDYFFEKFKENIGNLY